MDGSTEQRGAWAHLRRGLETFAAFWDAHDRLLYALFAATCTVYVAGLFYGYMLVQTRGVWSAPLDDVFIHFDYARSFARGYPFQWSEGNGYSSGNTSLTYPIVLGLGYWIGFRDTALMLWAAVVATASVFGFLTLSAGLLEPRQVGLGRWVKYLLPPSVLCMGALDWTLFSGMENAVHLLAWGLCSWAALRQIHAPDPRRAMRRAWVLGALGALLVATRPESSICVAVFGAYCAWRPRLSRAVGAPTRRRWPLRARILLATGTPAVIFLTGHALANRLLTGESSANGAIAKLFLNNPYMSAGDMWERYLGLLGYIVPRLTEHHFADARPWGYLIPALALLPLATRRTRPVAALLWSQIVGWMLLVGLNNQLRWHNERYAMPAVAWLLLLAALGLAVLASATAGAGGARSAVRRRLRWLGPAFGLLLALGYWQHQEPRMRDQIWFFGRASRNILHQHITAGRLLAKLKVRRVLVGDAGALIYFSDRPGLDLIGLGGYHTLPFARSSVHGLGASLELIERMAPRDRPDSMAIYPSWWGDLPTYFGRFVTAVPVKGNVICGGSEKVIYEADWSAMRSSATPRALEPTERVVDELDVADLLSEKAHGYAFVEHSAGFVHYRVLADPSQGGGDLFDAGRGVPAGVTTTAQLRAPRGPGRLLLRMAPARPTTLQLAVDGQRLEDLQATASDGRWQELAVALPDGLDTTFELSLTPKNAESVQYHLWVVEIRGSSE